jgi:hypothetical protein
MSEQFYKHKKIFIFSEKFGTVYFSLTCLYQLTSDHESIPCYSLAVYTTTLTEISHIKNKKNSLKF